MNDKHDGKSEKLKEDDNKPVDIPGPGHHNLVKTLLIWNTFLKPQIFVENKWGVYNESDKYQYENWDVGQGGWVRGEMGNDGFPSVEQS